MRPNPNLIPRFNLDFDFSDLLYSIKSIFNKNIDVAVLDSIFGQRKFYFTNYGRSALYVILKSLNLPLKSKIGVPLYSCNVVFDAIIKAGFIPKFIDIDDNFTIDPDDLFKKIDDLKAIIVIHTFGRPADMGRIKKIAGDIPIIEDCAHSLFSEYKDKKTGTFGNFSYFSLAKYISIGGGGMITTNYIDSANIIHQEISSLEKSSINEELKNIFISYARSFFYHKPWFGLISLPIGLSIEDKVDLMNKRNFNVSLINKSDLSLFLHKLSTFKEQVELQRNNSFFLIDALKENSIKLPYEKNNTYCNYYLFPILFKNKDERDKASMELRKRGVDNAKLFSKSPEIGTKQYGYDQDCPFTEQVADRILTLPNHYTLSNKELNKIVDITREVFQNENII